MNVSYTRVGCLGCGHATGEALYCHTCAARHQAIERAAYKRERGKGYRIIHRDGSITQHGTWRLVDTTEDQ